MAEWSAAAAALAFIVLVTGMLITMRVVIQKLTTLEKSAKRLEDEAADALDKVRMLSTEAAETVKVMQHHANRAEKLFAASEQLGSAVSSTAAVIQKAASVVHDNAVRNVEQSGGVYRRQIREAMEWAEVGWSAWQWVQAKRAEAAEASSGRARHGEEHQPIIKERDEQ